MPFPQGFTAIRDGIKSTSGSAPVALGGKPNWLRAPLPAGRGFDAVRQTVREHNVFRWAGHMLTDAGRARLRQRIEARVKRHRMQ